MKGLMLTIAFAAALASPAVAQSQWRDIPLPPDVQDIKAAGLKPYGEPILPDNWCTTLNRYPEGRMQILKWCGPVEAWQRYAKIVCLRQQADDASQAVGAAGCLAAQLSADKVRMAAENADRARQRALDAKRQLHDMGVE